MNSIFICSTLRIACAAERKIDLEDWFYFKNVHERIYEPFIKEYRGSVTPEEGAIMMCETLIGQLKTVIQDYPKEDLLFMMVALRELSAWKIIFESENPWAPCPYVPRLIEEENDLDEMLAYVKENPSSVEFYAEKLAVNYKNEIIEIYQSHLKSTASASSNRRDYQGVCNKILEFGRIAGKQKQTEMVNQLLALYRKKPAYIDELGKIK